MQYSLFTCVYLTSSQPSNSKRVQIALSDVSELERTDLADHSIVVNAGGRRYNIAFSTDSELYDWQDDIYRRTPLGGYSSNPFDFVHKSHIGTGIDTVSGTFTVRTPDESFHVSGSQHCNRTRILCPYMLKSLERSLQSSHVRHPVSPSRPAHGRHQAYPLLQSRRESLRRRPRPTEILLKAAASSKPPEFSRVGDGSSVG